MSDSQKEAIKSFPGLSSITLPITEVMQQLEIKSKQAGMLATADYSRFAGIITHQINSKKK